MVIKHHSRQNKIYRLFHYLLEKEDTFPNKRKKNINKADETLARSLHVKVSFSSSSSSVKRFPQTDCSIDWSFFEERRRRRRRVWFWFWVQSEWEIRSWSGLLRKKQPCLLESRSMALESGSTFLKIPNSLLLSLIVPTSTLRFFLSFEPSLFLCVLNLSECFRWRVFWVFVFVFCFDSLAAIWVKEFSVMENCCVVLSMLNGFSVFSSGRYEYWEILKLNYGKRYQPWVDDPSVKRLLVAWARFQIWNFCESLPGLLSLQIVWDWVGIGCKLRMRLRCAYAVAGVAI